MVPFDDVRLPENVEVGAVGGPSFNTGIITMANGEEQRTQNWAVPRHTYQIEYGTSETDWQAVRDFFYARRARARGFRFKDWTDYQVFGQTVNPTGTTQLCRTYVDDASVTYVRYLTRIVPGSIRIYDAHNTDLTAYYTESYGTLSLVDPAHPPAYVNGILADFEFDVPVRFDADQMALTAETALALSVGSLTLIELIETSAKLNGVG